MRTQHSESLRSAGQSTRFRRLAWGPLILVLAATPVISTAAPAARSARAASADSEPWWQHAVFYEIYPRSYKDTTGDGVGDLKGITAKLDYLKNLGIGAIWITPFYPSPQVDFGYDISNYEAVDPQFGALADFDKLLAEAHQRGIKVIMDMVLNHTSDKHTWFLESRSSRRNPKRDWYIWRDGTNGGPPNNWRSAFGGPAWSFDKKTGQWYYHFFYAAQPDLNWRNPEVEKAMLDQCRFWLKRGVDGFRLDAVTSLFEDPNLRDNPILPKLVPGSTTEHEEENLYNDNLPEVHTVLQHLRQVTGSFGPDRVLIGEIWVKTFADLVKYYGSDNNEVQLPFNFFVTRIPKLNAAAFREVVGDTEQALDGHWTTYVLSNHDIERAYSKYGDGSHNDAIAKLLATMLLTLRGTPFIYYGEEIGMHNNDPTSINQVRDPVGRRFWPKYKGRDGERTPMQWDASARAGFTTGKPWLAIPADYVTRNVAVESGDPSSVLSFYRRLLELRSHSPALLDGDYEDLGNDPHVFAYRRHVRGHTLVVALNMSPEKETLEIGSAVLGGATKLDRVLDNLDANHKTVPAAAVELAPYEAAVFEVRTK